MCTVSYMPASADRNFVLTSNRDERLHRQTLPPAKINVEGVEVCFPKDKQSGGSWISMGNNGRLCCLLNGGIVSHQKQAFHTYSRGKVLMRAVVSSIPLEDFFDALDLSNVEPFTIVSIDQKAGVVSYFSEFIWDGLQKHYCLLDIHKPYMWSSVTLYNESHRTERQEWWLRFLKETHHQPSTQEILGFHSGEHTQDEEVNVVMERDGGLKTVSITQVYSQLGKLNMTYADLLTHINYQEELALV